MAAPVDVATAYQGNSLQRPRSIVHSCLEDGAANPGAPGSEHDIPESPTSLSEMPIRPNTSRMCWARFSHPCSRVNAPT